MRMPRLLGALLALLVLVLGLGLYRLGVALDMETGGFLAAAAACLLAGSIKDAATPPARMLVVHSWVGATALFASALLMSMLRGASLAVVLPGVLLVVLGCAGSVWSYRRSRRRRRNAIFDGYLTR